MRRAAAAAVVLGSVATAMASPSVTAHGTLNSNGLLLDGRGTTSTRIVKVAEVSAAADSPDGLTLSVSSGSLTKGSGTPIAFQVVLVARDAMAPSSGSFLTPTAGVLTSSSSAAGTVELDLYIKYRAASLQDPGFYAATVDFDVVDN